MAECGCGEDGGLDENSNRGHEINPEVKYCPQEKVEYIKLRTIKKYRPQAAVIHSGFSAP